MKDSAVLLYTGRFEQGSHTSERAHTYNDPSNLSTTQARCHPQSAGENGLSQEANRWFTRIE